MNSTSKTSTFCAHFLITVIVLGVIVLAPMSAVASTQSHCDELYPNATTWYVKSGAIAAVSKGNISKPFASLADADAASKPGDRIVVLHVPAHRAPLDGGITLKDCQALLGTGPSVTTASPQSARSKITNSDGDAVVLANNNEVAGLHIENAGRHAIAAINVTGADIHGNLITGWNQLGEGSISLFGAPVSRAAVALETNEGDQYEMHIHDNVMRDSTSGAISVIATGGGTATAFTHRNVVNNIDGTGFFFGGRNPAISAVSFDAATVNLTVAGTAVDNIANRSDGIITVACVGKPSEGCFPPMGEGSEINLVVQQYSYRDTDRVGGGSSSGIETITIPLARSTVLIENSDIIGANGIGVFVWNALGKPDSDIIDLGGGALGSMGQNRIFGNDSLGRQNLGVLNADAVAEFNWWGTSDGLQLDCDFPAPEGSSCAGIIGPSSLDVDPFLTEDPRP